MKAILIEPNLIINEGLSLYLSQLEKIYTIESFDSFDHFLDHIKDKNSFNFYLVIINISSFDQIYGHQYIYKIDKLLCKGSIIIIHNNSIKLNLNRATHNPTYLFEMDNRITKLGEIINSIS